MKAQDILNTMVEKHHIMIAGCFDVLAGKVIRIGHMGNNANEADMTETLRALAQTLQELGFDVKADPAESFQTYMK